MALPCGPVPSNHHIVELVDEIKPKIRELIDNSNKVMGNWQNYNVFQSK